MSLDDIDDDSLACNRITYESPLWLQGTTTLWCEPGELTTNAGSNGPRLCMFNTFLANSWPSCILARILLNMSVKSLSYFQEEMMV